MIKIKQTEDIELLAEILKQLDANNNICPCSIRMDKYKDRCMCEAFQDVINSNLPGIYECNCGRFIATITKD